VKDEVQAKRKEKAVKKGEPIPVKIELEGIYERHDGELFQMKGIGLFYADPTIQMCAIEQMQGSQMLFIEGNRFCGDIMVDGVQKKLFTLIEDKIAYLKIQGKIADSKKKIVLNSRGDTNA